MGEQIAEQNIQWSFKRRIFDVANCRM